MATEGGMVLKVSGQSGAWVWPEGHTMRFAPAGTGMGAFLQACGWQLVYTDTAGITNMVTNWGQGSDFV